MDRTGVALGPHRRKAARPAPSARLMWHTGGRMSAGLAGDQHCGAAYSIRTEITERSVRFGQRVRRDRHPYADLRRDGKELLAVASGVRGHAAHGSLVEHVPLVGQHRYVAEVDA